MRNLEIGTLRSLMTIAEVGSMTRAASKLHMTQSAISMQVKRLEENLGLKVFDRYSHGMAPTPDGEQLIHYAQQMLTLNDEVVARLTSSQFEGQLSLGVPSDIIKPHIPHVLQSFSRDFPRVQVKIVTNNSRNLLKEYKDGKHDIVLTTERAAGEGGEVLSTNKLVWVGTPNGRAWKKKPLPIAICQNCMFRQCVIEALADAGIAWEDAVISEDETTVGVIIAADMGITTILKKTEQSNLEWIDHKGMLPKLPTHSIVMYQKKASGSLFEDALVNYIKQAYI